jgi:hypothetical protein
MSKNSNLESRFQRAADGANAVMGRKANGLVRVAESIIAKSCKKCKVKPTGTKPVNNLGCIINVLFKVLFIVRLNEGIILFVSFVSQRKDTTGILSN